MTDSLAVERGSDQHHGRPLNIVIMGDRFGFPYGTGASTRVFAYARGLQANGARVVVMCVEPSEGSEPGPNMEAKGAYRGIEFEYTYSRTTRPAQRWLRAWLKATKHVRFVRAARCWAVSHGGIDVVLGYTRSLQWILAARLLCSTTAALFVHDDCELPFARNTPHDHPVRFWLYHHVAVKAYDGSLAISAYLEDYVRRYQRTDADVLVVPILVDVADFDAPAGGAAQIGDAIVYCGYATHPEVFDLLEVFAGVAGEFPELRLQVIGGSQRPELLPRVWDVARRFGVAERLELVGPVKRDELAPRLSAARVLVLPRPDAPFSRAGLPTKLGEYLATGRPVVVSAVGDVPLYVRDGVDAYLARPGDLPEFVERLRHVLTHPDEAALVGERGRQTAAERFDPVAHGARIVDFVERLRRAQTASGRRAASRPEGEA